MTKINKSDLAIVEGILSNEKDTKLVKTETKRLLDLEKDFYGYSLKPMPGQREELSMAQKERNLFVSTILRGESDQICTPIVIGIIDGKQYINDGLQRLSVFKAFVRNEIEISYERFGVKSSKMRYDDFLSLNPALKEVIENASITVKYYEYVDVDAARRHLENLNRTSTKMTSNEISVVNTPAEIINFLKKYELESIMPVKKRKEGFSDRNVHKALNIELFYMAAFMKESLKHLTDLTKFISEVKTRFNSSRFTTGKKIYKEVMKCIDTLKVEDITFNHVSKTRTLWLALLKLYNDGHLADVMENANLVNSISFEEMYSIWNNDCEVVSGCCKNMGRLNRNAETIINKVFKRCWEKPSIILDVSQDDEEVAAS